MYCSMLATPQSDRLSYIFPVDLENAGDRVLEALKMQRPNVGFSRAKERMHFVVSRAAWAVPLKNGAGGHGGICMTVIGERRLPTQTSQPIAS